MKPTRIRKRTLIVLCAGVAVITGVILGRQYLNHQVLASVLSNPAPVDSAMNQYVSTSGDPAVSLAQLWETNRIPQRLFVLNYIRDHARNDAALWQRLRPLVLAATHLSDAEFQGDALARLSDHHDPELLAAAQRCLQSPDPEARQLALLQLSPLKDPQCAALFIKMLDDELKVSTIAAVGLRNLTGLDFGVRLTAKPEAIAAGIAQWKKWWQENQSHYPAPAAAESLAELPPGVSFPFALQNLEGKTVHLADYAGKVVILNIWATWCTPCIAEMPELRDLQAKHPDDLVILAISVDGVADDDGDDPPPTTAEQAATEKAIRDLVKEDKLVFPILRDSGGTTIGPYGAAGLPTSILITPAGQIRRRLIGARSPAAWEMLIAEARK